MTAKQNHDVLILGGVGAAGVLAYEFLYKPWKLKNDLAATSGAGSILPGYTPSGPVPYLPAPNLVGPAPGGVQGSIVDPRTKPGGDVGQAMYRKTWTEAQAKDRLDKLKAAHAQAVATIASLQGGSPNPNAAGIPAAQLALQQNEQAAIQARAQAAQNRAAGDVAGANIWESAAAAHDQDAGEIRARIAAASRPVDNSAAIAAYQGADAGYRADYFALTGMQLA